MIFIAELPILDTEIISLISHIFLVARIARPCWRPWRGDLGVTEERGNREKEIEYLLSPGNAQ